MGMDNISNGLPLVLTGLFSDARRIETSESTIVVSGFFLPTNSRHLGVIWSIAGVFCMLFHYIDACQTVLGIGLLDYCAG